MKYLITEDQIKLLIYCAGYIPILSLKSQIRHQAIAELNALKPIKPLSEEEIYAIWPFPKGTKSVQTLVRAIEAHILGEKHENN